MHILDLDVIGTHLNLQVEASSSSEIDEDFSHIRERLTAFEQKFSRFIPNNWLHKLNIDRTAELDEDAKNMLTYSLQLAHDTAGYFDPTIGKRLTELGYGNQEVTRKKQNTLPSVA